MQKISKSVSFFKREQEYIVGLSGSSQRSKLTFSRGKGCHVEDLDGNSYLDFTAGVGIMSTGHCHPKLVHAIQEQVEKLIGCHDATNRPRVELFELLSKYLPKRLRHFAMFSGGSETVEAALRFARAYTGRPVIIGFWGGFHGKSLGSLNVSGHEIRKQWLAEATAGNLIIPYAYCYRCPYLLTWPTCNTACADFGFKLIEHHSSLLPSALIIEPMQGTQGNIVPPREFIESISHWCRENNVLLIFDEILTGCGRTGKMFSFEHYDVEPDILLLGKGLGAGYPVGILALAEELALHPKINQVSAASTSFGGNPVAATAAKTNLEIILEEGLIENANKVGKTLINGFQNLKEQHKLIGDVRGRGLLIGVELVSDRGSRKKGTKEGEAVVAAALQRGLLLMASTGTLRINPPLILNEEQAKNGLTIIDEALSEVETKL